MESIIERAKFNTVKADKKHLLQFLEYSWGRYYNPGEWKNADIEIMEQAVIDYIDILSEGETLELFCRELEISNLNLYNRFFL